MVVLFAAIDPVVINVIGYLPVKTELYGIAMDKRAYLVSSDAGVTWNSISKARFVHLSCMFGIIS